ncbi:DUF190 domain-containing protein [Taibaiella soli]|uniref:Uncharacterized protein n=1 Tax=Taibaiella soli TaxID=1649169 RepID=A0A2W2BUY1_9BACT|nr:DUF190 domain-containing protein [Taibaiella soli]PZF71623.1 hypothetical protein DN068_16245 [Taibaiella soli]
MNIKISTDKLGSLRIFIKANDMLPATSFWYKLFPINLSRYLIKQAKLSGIRAANILTTQAGYCNGSAIQTWGVETGSYKLTLCVELVDTLEKLEDFFRNHQTLLKNKLVLFRELERWQSESQDDKTT